MNLFLDPTFWVVSLVLYLLLHVKVPLRATLQFGLLNVLALLVLLGVRTGLLVAGFAVLFWVCLRGIRFIRSRGLRRGSLAGFLILFSLVVAMFVVNKLNLQCPWFFDGPRSHYPKAVEQLLNVLIAVSFSYVFLRAIDMIRVVVFEDGDLLDPISLVGYLAPFHMLVAGPICAYRDHLAMDKTERGAPTFSGLLRGVNLITTGLLFKLVIADGMRIYAFGLAGGIKFEGWFGAAFALVYVFFDFAGYSLVCLGIGRLCGVPTPRNFTRPFFASSITQFWTRWHVSLGDFVRRNIFMPLQLYLMRLTRARIPAVAGFGSLVASFTFVALWHHLGVKIVIWGLLMGTIMVLEKIIRDRCLKMKWAQSRVTQVCVKLIGPVYVFVVITTGLQFIVSEVIN